MEIPDFANSSSQTENLGDIQTYTAESSRGTPIDDYLSAVTEFLNFGTPERLLANPFLGRLLALAIIAEAENYIRFCLAHTLELCPRSQAACATQQINLGGLLWHGKSAFGRSAFEHLSFASKDDIRKAYRNFADFPLDDSKFQIVLNEFEKVCQLRHGIVHGGGFMPGRNAVALGVRKTVRPQKIVVGYAELQSIAAVVGALVFTLNRGLFAEMCKRWAKDWRELPTWDATESDRAFAKIWAMFHSKRENLTRPGRSFITRKNCKLEIESVYGLS
ncbi:hypothetical protein [Alteriqipengyuania lutimaris]|uniref:hypothetical protein n=1 Tax=Alteriqipengyuania lutimaris TaxID=1538146 RepID=UPI0011C079DE|nr:hypothetical protein [Alteriqipengyuania lutimaris]MBB3034941.1 hypothetical protein [Alteriqipengyuania lutimaris]